MKITGEWIGRAETQAVCRMLEQAGYQALFVGGCVRNAFLKEPVRDIDIATDALPQTVTDLARKAGLKPVPTGIDHGTVTVVSGGKPHEVTTFRADTETDGRHARVAFSSDVTEDARRRDFTMNALYARPDGTVIDPLSGLGDLRVGLVRFIENPGDRIREDYLRILRFFRFHAWYGRGGPDPDGLAACAELADGVEALSRERTGAEMLKLLAAPEPAPAVAAMCASGVLPRVLPGADDALLAPLVVLEGTAGTDPDAIRRLAALGGEDVQKRLRLSRQQGRRLGILRAKMTGAACAAELGYRHGDRLGCDILLLRRVMENRPLAKSDLEDIALGASARFPVHAADLMPEFEGPALGRELAVLEQRWIESRFSLTREDLLG